VPLLTIKELMSLKGLGDGWLSQDKALGGYLLLPGYKHTWSTGPEKVNA